MSRYTVVWWPRALADLAELWLASDDRESVTADADEIDRRLAEQATEWGSPLANHLRWMDHRARDKFGVACQATSSREGPKPLARPPPATR